MKVSVNGKMIEVFGGARVRDALRQFSSRELKAVENGEKRVYDRWGNEVKLDGSLSGNEVLSVR